MGRNGLTEITRLSITPTAKRNSYRVAILVETLPRVAGHARNPGLCNRNSYRVAAADGPSPALPKGRESILAVFEDVWWRSFPLEMAGMGLLCWPQKYPSPVSLFGETGEGLVAAFSLPLEGTEKVPFFYDQNGKCLRFVTSLSANRLK